MKLSEIIRKYRADHDISQREFAKRCNLSNSYISFIENERNPKTGRPMTRTIEQYKKLADGMSISVQELFESLDVDSPVILNSKPSGGLDLQFFSSEPPDRIRTVEARILARGIDSMPAEQREQALNIMKTVFIQYKDLFEKENNNDDA